MNKDLKIKEWSHGLILEGIKNRQSKINIVTIYNNEGVSEIRGGIKKVMEEIEGNESVIVIGD